MGTLGSVTGEVLRLPFVFRTVRKRQEEDEAKTVAGAASQAPKREGQKLIELGTTKQTSKSPGSFSLATALRYMHLPNGLPSFAGPKDTHKHHYYVGQCGACT